MKKQQPTAKEVLKKHHQELTKGNTEDWMEFEEDEASVKCMTGAMEEYAMIECQALIKENEMLKSKINNMNFAFKQIYGLHINGSDNHLTVRNKMAIIAHTALKGK